MDAACTVEIDTPAEIVALGARIIRSGVDPDQRARIDEPCIVAIAFVDVEQQGKRVVELLCGDAYSRVE